MTVSSSRSTLHQRLATVKQWTPRRLTLSILGRQTGRMSDTTTTSGSVRESLLEAARIELIEHGRASISLRAVARRAEVSHASPKYFFRDKAGMLTVLATEGFRALTSALRAVRQAATPQPLAAVGHTYIDFGLQNAALFDLMFSPGDLHADDPELLQAQHDAIGELTSAVAEITGGGPLTPRGTPQMSLISWALAHGLVVLARDGALQAATGAASPDATAQIAKDLTEVFDARITTSD